MKKVALTAAGILLVASSSLFAQPFYGKGFAQGGNCYFNDGNYNCAQGMRWSKMGMHRGHGMNGCGGYGMNGGMYADGGFMFFNNLNLTPEQRYNISILRDEMRLEMKRTLKPKYFSDNKFDKNMYMKNTKEYYDQRLEIRAKYMEKAYNLLTKEQKEILGNSIDY